MDEEQKPRERSFIDELVPEWGPTRAHVQWTIRFVIVLVTVLGILTLVGLPFDITLWQWLKLLIVPAVIAAGGIWFNRQQRDREMEIAEQRAQHEALQAYLDQISQLLTDEKRPLRRASPGDNLSAVARARTLRVVFRLDGDRKARVVQFLYESGLITKNRPVLDLRGADLRDANLGGAILNRAKLSGTSLNRAKLSGASLSKADLRSADLRTAALDGAYLRGADLRDADLSRANLNEANLSNAHGITKEQLEKQTKNLEGAIMPGGSEHA